MSEQLEQQPPAATTVPETFKVKVLDLHTEDRYEYSATSMDEAINLYKQVVAAARNVEPRPFVYLDDAQWIALVKFSGGLVRQVWVADSTGKVRGHNAGMRRREQQRQNPVAFPPAIVPVAKATTQTEAVPPAQPQAENVPVNEPVPF